MKPDFSGYASKNNILCADGRTIMPGAFKGNDKAKVPLVWAHQHDGSANILGHAILENRPDGVYTHGYFNETENGKNAKLAVQHGDIEALSIFANQLVHQGTNVIHGNIREVSLVIAGANPGAFIQNVELSHGDGTTEPLEDQAIIFLDTEGSSLTHGDAEGESNEQIKETPVAITTNTEPVDGAAKPTNVEPTQTPEPEIVPETPAQDAPSTEDGPEEGTIAHTFQSLDAEQQELAHALISVALGNGNDLNMSDEDIDSTFSSMTEQQQMVVHSMIGEALATNDGAEELSHADTNEGAPVADETVKDVFDTLSEKQKNVVYFMIGQAVDDATSGSAAHSALGQEGSSVNVFDQNKQGANFGPTLSHDQLGTIVKDAEKMGSFKESFLAHAQEYGIENIDILFPDAKALAQNPEIISRRMEWVTDVINGTKHSPFSRIKSTAVDLTADEARAKGYVKGNLKKDEIIKLLKRVTTPTTIYKKQKLDRDDIIDITDLDVVAWLKAEMRLMLDEELARAVLIGDGREADDEDKIDEDSLRPIAFDADMYAHQVVLQSDLSEEETIEAVIRSRTYYKGTGTPTFYTTDAILTDLLLLKDKIGRRLYDTVDSLANALRVKNIVPVEVMEDVPELVGIMVNLADYTLGADQGGNVSMFDDFDIDYNQYKYLIETRVSGALTKPKSAIVIKRTVGTIVTPQSPSYDSTTHTLTFPATAGVIYTVDGETVSGNKVIEETTDVSARPATGYSFPNNTNRDWVFSYTA